MTKKAVFLDIDTFGKDVSLNPLKDLPLEWTFYPLTTAAAETLNRISDAEIVVSNKVLLTRNILEKSKNLKIICIAATGYNNVDLQAAEELKIPVCNIPAYSTPAVVQHTITLMLALSQNLISYAEATKSGRWQKHPMFCILDYPILELQGKKLGIIGYGILGKEVSRIAKAFGMEILIAGHTSSSKTIEGSKPLEKILKEADFITLHVPLTEKTKDLISKKELDLMKPTAFLINTARGGIVNEKDLADALKNKKIAGAGVDVLSKEPPEEKNPLLQKNVPNLILTPHIAWASVEARKRSLDILIKNIKAFLEGKSQNIVSSRK